MLLQKVRDFVVPALYRGWHADLKFRVVQPFHHPPQVLSVHKALFPRYVLQPVKSVSILPQHYNSHPFAVRCSVYYAYHGVHEIATDSAGLPAALATALCDSMEFSSLLGTLQMAKSFAFSRLEHACLSAAAAVDPADVDKMMVIAREAFGHTTANGMKAGTQDEEFAECRRQVAGVSDWVRIAVEGDHEVLKGNASSFLGRIVDRIIVGTADKLDVAVLRQIPYTLVAAVCKDRPADHLVSILRTMLSISAGTSQNEEYIIRQILTPIRDNLMTLSQTEQCRLEEVLGSRLWFEILDNRTFSDESDSFFTGFPGRQTSSHVVGDEEPPLMNSQGVSAC
eukprot:ANDGO_04768.mRNA.1 hypothetical protein